MGEHGGAWLSNLNLGFHPPFMRSSPTVHEDPSLGNLISGLTSHNTNMSLKSGATLPANDSRCWFYSLPHFQPAIPLASNSVGNGEIMAQNIASGFVPKRFLVVDQYKDQTTLMFSSGGVGTAVKCLNSLSPEFPNSCLNFEEPGREKDSNWKTNAVLSSDLSKEDYLSSESEMHEDTEELNALLYSDEDDSDYEEDEVTSTGHSPNNEADEFSLILEEEVASSVGPTRKRKKSAEEEDCVIPFKVYTSVSSKGRESLPSKGWQESITTKSKCGKEKSAERKRKKSAEEEDCVIPFKVYTSVSSKGRESLPSKGWQESITTKSKCGKEKSFEFEEASSFSSNKRSRKEKIRQTVSVLRSIIPGSQGKESMAVLDEAIHYLRFLKLKAKTLGLNSL